MDRLGSVFQNCCAIEATLKQAHFRIMRKSILPLLNTGFCKGTIQRRPTHKSYGPDTYPLQTASRRILPFQSTKSRIRNQHTWCSTNRSTIFDSQRRLAGGESGFAAIDGEGRI